MTAAVTGYPGGCRLSDAKKAAVFEEKLKDTPGINLIQRR
jgi:hypothetical protein